MGAGDAAPPSYYADNTAFAEAQDGGSFGFSEKSVRQNFIAKVMTIVGSMLATTFTCVGLVKIACKFSKMHLNSLSNPYHF